MGSNKKKDKRSQSKGEEIANAISHGVGFFAAIASIPVIVIYSEPRIDAGYLTGAIIFSTSMILLYLASTMYHALPQGKAKSVFQTLDHTAIFLLIAGTYTPFALGILRGPWGWTLFGLIWGLAFLGIGLELAGKLQSGKISNTLYLVMGWSAILVIKPLMNEMPFQGLMLLLSGGLFYSLGVWFYVKDYKKYYHFIWHLFVAAGSTAHFFTVLWYA